MFSNFDEKLYKEIISNKLNKFKKDKIVQLVKLINEDCEKNEN